VGNRSTAIAIGVGALLILLGMPASGRPQTPSDYGEFGNGKTPLPAFALSAPSERPRPLVFALALSVAPEREATRAAAPAAAEMPKKWGRYFLELGVVSVIATIRYWTEYHEWIEDWQYELNCEDQYRRFFTTEAIRFDSNAYKVNWAHVMGGAAYYQFARTSYLTPVESLLTAFGASLVYEYVTEWREVISVNDMILATAGGYSLGETWFQLSNHFHHQKSPGLRALGFMNPILKLNKWMDRKNPASKVYINPDWHAFVLSAGYWHSTSAGGKAFGAGYIGFDTQIIRLPEYGRPGVFRKTLRDTSLSEIAVDVALRQRRSADEDLRTGMAEEVNFFTRVVGLASYRQNIDELGRGYMLSIGLGSALTYLRKRPVVYDSRGIQVRLDPPPATPTDFRDKMTVTHIVGPVIDWTRFLRGLKIRVVADAFLDFALMNAYAFNAYSAVHPIEGLKTTLSYYGYHYAFGASVSGRVDLDWRALWLRGLVSYHFWDSVEGLDRFQADLLDDGNVVDTRTRFLIKAGWRLPRLPLRLFFALEGIRRWGKIADIEARGRETRRFAGLSYLF
jgi:hypothetical protein